MQADLAVANAILKEDYLGPLRSALNVSTPVLDRLIKNTRDISGLEAWIPVEMALSQAGGARAEDAVIPATSKGEYKELRTKLKFYYGTMGVSGPALRQTQKGEKGSFGRIVDIEAKGMKNSLGLILAHDFYLGHELAKHTAEGPVGTLTLAANTNMQYFFKGMIVDIVDATTGVAVANGTARTIASVDRSAGTYTVTGAADITTVVTDITVRTATFGNTVTSLEQIISATTDIYGVVTANFEAWRATESPSTGAFSTTKLQTHLNKVVVASGKMPTAIFSDYDLQQKYWEELTGNRQYVPVTPPKVLDGGFRALEYSGGSAPLPWIADRFTPKRTIYTVHEPDLQVFTPGDWKFIDIGGDVWLPDILGASGKDNYKAVLQRDMELGAYNRNSHGKLLDVT